MDNQTESINITCPKINSISGSVKKYLHTPTMKLSDRKRALFQNETQEQISNHSDEELCSLLENQTDNFRNTSIRDTRQNILATNLYKNSSFLSHIEDTNDVDFLLSVENSSDSFDLKSQTTEENCIVNSSESQPLNTLDINLIDNHTLINDKPDINFTTALNSFKAIEFNLPSSASSVTTESGKETIQDTPKSVQKFTGENENKENIFSKNISNNDTVLNRPVLGSISLNLESTEQNATVPFTPLQKDTPKTPYETLNTSLELPRINNRKSLIGIFNNCPPDTLNEKYIDLGSSDATIQPKNTRLHHEDSNPNSRRHLYNLKRKYENSPLRFSPPAKSAKTHDKKLSKARTSLFTSTDTEYLDNQDNHSDILPTIAMHSIYENQITKPDDEGDTGFSPKMFYSKSSGDSTSTTTKSAITDLIESRTFYESVSTRSNMFESLKSNSKRTRSVSKKSVFLCGRGRTKKRKPCGEINGGVRTGIKKIKKSKLTRSLKSNTNFKKEALDMVSNQKKSIQVEPNLNLENNFIMISEIPASSSSQKSKRPLSPDISLPNLLPQLSSRKYARMENSTVPVPVFQTNERATSEKKFFKSHCPGEKFTINNLELNVDSGKMKLPTPECSTNEPVVNCEPVKPKKFFKSHCPRENFTLDILNNIKLKIQNGKMKLQQPKSKRYSHPARNYENSRIVFNTSDLAVQEENVTLTGEIEKVIDTLEKMEEKSDENKGPDNAVAGKTAIDVEMDAKSKNEPPTTHKLPQITRLNTPENKMMSPTSLMCDLTSGLALCSPKKIKITKAENLADKLAQCPNKDEQIKSVSNFDSMKNAGSTTAKLYPLFMRGHSANVFSPSSLNKKVTRSGRVWQTLDDRQYQLDAGQKRWGATQCPQCEAVYQQGEPDDERKHLEFHNKVQYLKFYGWKNERIVGYFNNNQGRIIEIVPDDSKAWWKKINELLFVVDKELGYDQSGVIDATNTKVYLYIEKRQILGFLSVRPISQAYKMIPNITVDCCTEECFPVKCGVSRLWVANFYRRKGIATKLMDTVRKSFIFGYHLPLSSIAFSVPSASGKSFAKSYTKSEEFLVYTDD